ncbi:GyrI-like domain-containing protein [Devosia faecipullorum]|uniref:GyrI-like domain-containing protein n=1 Tax=Devosia faecipullorum TaxID=2755039 RepID=UPI00187B85EA|nr:GyrI-like domain-containing protein [Devosia faecipullorum]MBE7731510.1 GyrI-like domain-containing protein [Devosia faecipullorum]
MMTLPEITIRPAQSYVYVPFTVTMRQMQRPASEGFPLLFDYIARHGLTPIGAPFYNYRRINMAETLDVEAGIAVDHSGPETDSVKVGTLPAGRFMGLTWHGHPDALETVTGMLIGWSELTRQPFDRHSEGKDDFFACRLEIYESDPAEVPDMQDWVTTLAFRLAD